MKIVNGIIKDVNIPGVEFKTNIIPSTCRKRRPGYKLIMQYITIHNTGCPNIEADNFSRSQADPSQDQYKSWHIQIGSKEIIQSLPLNEVGWHAGTDAGNYSSSGIEICEVPGAEEVAIKFIAQLLQCLGKGTEILRTHNSWSGKNCPRLILPHWKSFVENIANNSGNVKDLTAYVEVLHRTKGIDVDLWNNSDKIKLKNVPALLAKLGGTVKLKKDGVINDEHLWEQRRYTINNVVSLIIKAANVYFGEVFGITTANLNARKGPGTHYSSIGIIAKGSKIKLTGVTGDWFRVNWNGDKVYVSSQYVKIN